MRMDLALVLARVPASLMLAFAYGLPKLLNFGERVQGFPDPLGIGAAASLSLAILTEAILPIFVAFGLFARVAAAGVLATQLVAAVLVHAGAPWAARELAYLYALPFAITLLAGAGRYSLDAALPAWRAKRRA